VADSGLAGDLSLAVTLAREAGDGLLRHGAARDRLRVSAKRAGDFVSEADCEAEAGIRRGLARARPGDGWLGEESGAGADAARRWIVDPLDGTTNFLHGIGHWAVSVALEVDGELALGVIHDATKDETFTALRGGGAMLNGKAITVSSTERMDRALFGTGIPFGTMPHIDDHAADIARLMPRCAGVRRFGAASLDLAYVACGRLDGFWERRLQLWDIAAGLVVLREAGTRVEGWTPEERPEASGTVLAAPPTLFAGFASCLRGD
jgi:myo-inositol-1(or 4)-monophosphatase